MGKEVMLIIMLGAMQGFNELVDWPRGELPCCHVYVWVHVLAWLGSFTNMKGGRYRCIPSSMSQFALAGKVPTNRRKSLLIVENPAS
jgi:hypothetical protein